METTWGPSGSYGDNAGMTETTRDDVGMMGTMWGLRGQHRVETTETTGHGDHIGTFWGLWG